MTINASSPLLNHPLANTGAAGAGNNVNIDCISVDSIMAYCATRMNDLDLMLRSKMQQQTNQNNVSKQWSDLQGLMQHCAGAGIVKGGDQSGNKAVSDQLLAQYNATTDPALRIKLGDAFTKFTGKNIADGPVANPEPKDPVSASDFAGFIEEIKTDAGSVSQGSDLAMVEIQSLVSQRQQAMQLTSQMLQSESEIAKNILGNTGR